MRNFYFRSVITIPQLFIKCCITTAFPQLLFFCKLQLQVHNLRVTLQQFSNLFRKFLAEIVMLLKIPLQNFSGVTISAKILVE
jgi:hypothetical protein